MRCILLAPHVDPRVPFLVRHDLVRHGLDLLHNLIVPSPHKPLNGENGVFRVRDSLPLRGLAYEYLPVLRKGNDTRRKPAALFIDDYLRVSAFHDCDN